jgi:hypothetical protein
MALDVWLSMRAEAADALLLQLHMQAAPVIQKETLIASSKRTSLIGKSRIIRLQSIAKSQFSTSC